MLTRDHPTLAVVLGIGCGLIISALLGWLIAQGPGTIFAADKLAQARIVVVASASGGEVAASAFRPAWLDAGEVAGEGPGTAARVRPQAAPQRRSLAMASAAPRVRLAVPVVARPVASGTRAAPPKAKPANDEDKDRGGDGSGTGGNGGHDGGGHDGDGDGNGGDGHRGDGHGGNGNGGGHGGGGHGGGDGGGGDGD